MSTERRLDAKGTVAEGARWPRAAARVLALVAFYSALTALMTYPLSLSPAHRALNLGADTRLFVWTLGWDVHAMVHEPLGIFDANIFFPNPHTLAYSENLIGVAALVAPFVALSSSLLLPVNMASLLSCVLCGLGAHALARELKLSTVASFVAGIVFAFSPPRFFRIGQLHLTSVEWMPFCLVFVHRYLEGGRRRDLLCAASLFTLQVASSGHGGVFLGVSLAALLLFSALVKPGFSFPALARDLGPAGLLLLGLSAPLALPYVEVRQEQRGLERTFEEAQDGSPNLQSFIASPSHFQGFLLSFLPSSLGADEAKAFLFPGFLPLFLACVALFGRGKPMGSDRAPRRGRAAVALALEYAAILCLLGALLIRLSGGGGLEWGSISLSARSPSRALLLFSGFLALRLALAPFVPLEVSTRLARLKRWAEAWSERRGGALAFYAPLTVLGAWASMGPRAGLYTLLYYVPGFSFIRIPSRIFIVALLGLSVLAGAGVDRLRASFPALRSLALSAGLVVLVVAELAAFPLKAPPLDVAIPEIDRWLAGQATPFAIAEMPVPDPDRGPHSDLVHALYMVHSMAHWQKTVSGYSGFRPLGHSDLYDTLSRFPDEASLKALEDLHVTYVVVHTDYYPPDEVEGLLSRIDAFRGRLHLAHVAGAGRLYSLRGSPPPT